jgi:hypothetical protein
MNQELCPFVSYNARDPLNAGESLIANLPKMVLQPSRYPFDFVFNQRSTGEVKFASAPRLITYASGCCRKSAQLFSQDHLTIYEHRKS